MNCKICKNTHWVREGKFSSYSAHTEFSDWVPCRCLDGTTVMGRIANCSDCGTFLNPGLFDIIDLCEECKDSSSNSFITSSSAPIDDWESEGGAI